MLRITDRYILREVIPPFFLGLLIFTFLLMIPPIMEVVEELIAKGVDAVTVLQIVGTLVPQGLGITIPMALLLGVLMGLGRMSSDRETVALQACGVSLLRMFRPLLVLALFASAATCYVMVVALPDANQRFREITFRTVANRAEGEVKPRVFYEDFPNVVLYVREVLQTGEGWRDVFLADMRDANQPDVYVASRGQVVLDPEQRTVDVVLHGGTGHVMRSDEPGTYEVHAFDEIVIGLDPESVFPRSGPQRGYPELTISQLRAEAARLSELGASPHRPIMEIHRKFSIPVACFVFVLIGIGLGVTSRKDGRLASFALGLMVIFTYYVIMYGAEAMAKGALVSPHLAMWLPNILLGLVGLALFVWRSASVERRIALPFSARRRAPAGDPEPAGVAQRGRWAGIALPKAALPNLSLLDWYVFRMYVGVLLLGFVGLLGVFYISTFIDLSDKLFKGQTTGLMLLEYFWYATPQFTYFVLPVSALVAALVTIGLLTKTSELTVMKACGVSLYRAALPIFLASIALSGVLFGLSETIMAAANREAEALNFEIRSGVRKSRTIDLLSRQWIVARDGSIYHYLHFEPERNEIGSLSVYEFGGEPWGLQRRTFAGAASYADGWRGRDVWTRDFTAPAGGDGQSIAYETAAEAPLAALEPPDYFATERPDAELMNFGQLSTHIGELSASGFDVVRLVVELHRKVSFPFVTLILTLIAIPFAVTTGPRGTLFGIGVGVALAFTYWITINVFAAVGSAGLLAPGLAAWAPNLLFGASATYLLLTVRT
ncbi:MAG: LPS export ABC transporter permease LptF [Acidobacteria bacterium]|nr:LPS export ABC transporter permease LptF [Acidobacteriota bacterium]